MKRLITICVVLGMILAISGIAEATTTSPGITGIIYLGDGTSGNQYTGDSNEFGTMPDISGGASTGPIWAENGFDIFVPSYTTEWNTTSWPYDEDAPGHNFADYKNYALEFNTAGGLTAYQAGKLSGNPHGDVPGTWDWAFSYYGANFDSSKRENAIFYGTMTNASLVGNTFTATLLLDDSLNGYHGFETHDTDDGTYGNEWGEDFDHYDGTTYYGNDDFDRLLTKGGSTVSAYNLVLNLGSPTVVSGTMTPIPEPATIVLLGFGALSLLHRKRSV